MQRHAYQKGLSLVELMVALAISSFLIIGVTQIYIDNKRSYLFQQGQSANQEGSRYTLLFFQQELLKAGYLTRPDKDRNSEFPAQSRAGCSFGTGQTAYWDNETNGGSLCIRYQPQSPTSRNCLGNLISGPDKPYQSTDNVIVERFFLQDDTLWCEAMSSSGTSSQKAELLNGIADLRFEFGLGDRQVKEFSAQHDVSTNDNLTAIRYAALLRTTTTRLRDDTNDSPVLARWQTLTNATDAEMQTLRDEDARNLYQIAQSTLTLRNLLP